MTAGTAAAAVYDPHALDRAGDTTYTYVVWELDTEGAIIAARQSGTVTLEHPHRFAWELADEWASDSNGETYRVEVLDPYAEPPQGVLVAWADTR